MKLGRNFPKVRQVLAELGLDGRALYVERATMANQKIVPLDEVDPQSSPYFSLIIVPGENGRDEQRTGHRHPRPRQPGHRAAHPATLSTGRDPWPAGRVEGPTVYSAFGDTLRALYRQDTPIIALCAAGIVIRTLAPLLDEKGSEPPVLAVAEDGSAGAAARWPGRGECHGAGNRRGAGRGRRDHHQRRAAFRHLPAQPARGLCLADLELGKRFVSDLLAGETVRIEGDAPWLDQAQLPASDNAQRTSMWAVRARPTATSC
jgi:hypothetical protein